ncbi:helix-turn-helix domain-containing protein [Mycobacterium marinum]|uniref:helix-turn-helix domain-containing protein n=1 Tax=Mycobacterium marinum TaxID=1781 RepID=UPI0004169DDF|nr:helix-turn-helix domain-containing protein [Mycobacterium marinum]
MSSNNDSERHRQIFELLAETGGQRDQVLHGIEDERERSDLAALLDTADALWLSAHGAPPLADDPVAALLGLIPDRECSLDSRSLKQARKRAGLTVSDLADRLRQRGWEVDKNDVFRWETRSATDVAPAVIEAMSRILDWPVERMILTSPVIDDELAEVRRQPAFSRLVDRWARIQRVSREAAAAALETRLLATVHRGQRPDSTQLLRLLEELINSVEESDE